MCIHMEAFHVLIQWWQKPVQILWQGNLIICKTCYVVFLWLSVLRVWAFYSIVYDNEFSARLSVGSIHRLRAAAIVALSQDSKTDTALMYRLARQFLYLGQYQSQGIRKLAPGSIFNSDPVSTGEYGQNICGDQYSNTDKGITLSSFANYVVSAWIGYVTVVISLPSYYPLIWF